MPTPGAALFFRWYEKNSFILLGIVLTVGGKPLYVIHKPNTHKDFWKNTNLHHLSIDPSRTFGARSNQTT